MHKCTVPGWRNGVAWLVMFSAVFLGGCGMGSHTPLPELTRTNTNDLSPDQQKRAIKELEAERVKLDAEAAKTREAIR